MSENAYPDKDPRIYFDLARDRLSTQLLTLDAVDSKISVLFTTSTALLGILAAVLALKSGTRHAWDYIPVAASVLAYLFVSCHAQRAYRPRKWYIGGDLKETWKMYSEFPESDQRLGWRVANRIRIDYGKNEGDVRAKSDALERIFRGLVIQSLSLVLALVLAAA